MLYDVSWFMLLVLLLLSWCVAGSAADATTADVHAEWHARHRTGRSEQLPRTTVAVGASSTLQGAPQVASSPTRQTALSAAQSRCRLFKESVCHRDPIGLSASLPTGRPRCHVVWTAIAYKRAHDVIKSMCARRLYMCIF